MTPSQTVGPYFAIGLAYSYATAMGGVGTPVTLAGRVLDGDGKPVPDACLEFWQADAEGRYGAPGFRGFGRVGTGPDGSFRVTTTRPGTTDGMAPHIAVVVFARGLLRHLVTRVYFPEATDDPVLRRVPAERRGTLIARPGDGVLLWDIVLQGPGETVFFDV